MILNGPNISIITLSAVVAGLINALAGGGTLITFPVLTLLGLPPVVANITNTVALCPGYFGATLAQRKLLIDQKRRLKTLLPAGILGGIAGGVLLVSTDEKLFRALIPFLILFATLLLAAQTPAKQFLERMGKSKGRETTGDTGSIDSSKAQGAASILCIGIAAVYGGYFGAGLSVIILAALGITITDSLVRLNALKQSLSFSINVAAAVFFIFSGRVNWLICAIMAVSALAGGTVGGKLANRISPTLLKIVVVTFGAAIGLYYLIR
jgi:hypothetical protein